MERETTLPQEVSDEVLIGRFRQWASEMSPLEAAHILATGSAESMIAYLRSQNRPLPSDPHKLWGLFSVELLARTDSLNASHGTVGTA